MTIDQRPSRIGADQTAALRTGQVGSGQVDSRRDVSATNTDNPILSGLPLPELPEGVVDITLTPEEKTLRRTERLVAVRE